MIEAKQTHCGQYKRYGDFFREWFVESDMSEEETLEWCFSNLYKRRVPESAEWHANIRIGGAKSGDAGYYFAGYYTFKKVDNGYRFVICEPNAD